MAKKPKYAQNEIWMKEANMSLPICPSCKKSSFSYYFHTEMTLIHCMNRKCKTYWKYGFQTYNQKDKRFGEIICKVAWNQRGIKDNKPKLYMPFASTYPEDKPAIKYIKIQKKLMNYGKINKKRKTNEN